SQRSGVVVGAAMEGKKARKNAQTPHQKTEDEEKTTDGANHKTTGFVRSMRKLMKNKKKKSDKSGSSSGSTTTTGSSSSRHHLVSEFTRARPHKETAAPKPGEKVDDKELRGAPALVATPGVPVGPTLPTPVNPIPQATMMVFTVFENDPAAKGAAGGGEKLAVCRPDKDAKLQWQSEEAERAASRERSKEDQTDEDHARTTTPEEKTPVKKKSKQRTKKLDSQHPTAREKAKTPMKGGRTPVTAKGRTPARTPRYSSARPALLGAALGLLPFLAGDGPALAELCKSPKDILVGTKFHINANFSSASKEFMYACAKRTISEWPHKEVDLADKATIQTSILYALVVILALFTAAVSVHWYIRDKRETERVRELIDYHLIAMRRARYLKARAKRESSFQRRAGIAQRKEEKMRQKKKKEDEERRRKAKEERRSKGKR
ncbi:hypothetical protein PRIPAC_93785, partial [Pristionchus pacificus]|uniref:Uncharacterized protein n=1 Tax=Pristionchus pacificus TaxID=54126 RepID=A0A2A6BIH8_PRIPA